MDGQITDSPCDCGVFKSFDKICIVCFIIPLLELSVIAVMTARAYLVRFCAVSYELSHFVSYRTFEVHTFLFFFKKSGLADTT